MRRRREPGLLMTTAVVGTTAYVATSSASKKAAQQQAAAQQPAATQQQLAELEATHAALAQQQAMQAQTAAAPAANSFDDQLIQIQKLSVMKDQGLITDPLGSRMIPGEDDGTVSVSSARLEGMRDFLTLPVSHTAILRSGVAADQTLSFLRIGRFQRESVQ